MKLEHLFVAVVIMLLFFPMISCFVPVAKAELPDSWVNNLEIVSFNGDNIYFNLQVTVRGNHFADSMWIQIEPTSSGDGMTLTVSRGITRKIYSQDTNMTVFYFDYFYAVRSPLYEAVPKVPFLNLLLFPADSHSLTFYLVPSFNITVDTHPTLCQVPSQNYQGTFALTQASDRLTVNVSINHSQSYFLGVLFILVTTLVSLYGLTAYLGVVIHRKKSKSFSNIVTVSSAIIFFVPAFEIAFYSLKSPLPLVFSDILVIILIPINTIVIGLTFGMSPVGVIRKLRSKFSKLGYTIRKALTSKRNLKSAQQQKTLSTSVEKRRNKKTEEEALAQPKPHLRPQLTSKSVIILLCLGVLSVVGGFVGGFIARLFGVPFPQIPEEISILILCSLTVILAYAAKVTRPEFSILLLMFTGILIGVVLNRFFSLEFLSKPPIISMVVELPTVIITLIAVLCMRRNKSLYENLRHIFLGVSLFSLLSAFWVFVNLIEVYLPLFPAHELGSTWFLPFDFSLVINIFKSLFLTGLFSFLERLLRIFEEAKLK